MGSYKTGSLLGRGSFSEWCLWSLNWSDECALQIRLLPKDKKITRACCDRTRENVFKLIEDRFKLALRKKFFTGEAVAGAEHWNSGFPIPGSVPGWLSKHPAPVEGVCAHAGVWNWKSFRVPSNLNPSMKIIERVEKKENYFSSCLWFSKCPPRFPALHPSPIHRPTLPVSNQYFWEGIDCPEHTLSSFLSPHTALVLFWLQSCCSILSGCFYPFNFMALHNPRPALRMVDLLGFQWILIKIRHLKAPMLHLLKGGEHVLGISDSALM